VIGARETAHAKLNLALHVRARMADGYHALETLFAFCADGDMLELMDGPGLIASGPFAGALDANNLVTRAAHAYRTRFGGVEAGFRLTKCLPVAAGLGGGSADAAAALRLLARRDGREVGTLVEIAASLGADVPACLWSRTMRGEGRGEQLSAAGDVGGVPVLLVNPAVCLETGPVFKAWDGVDRGALPHGDPISTALDGRNDLEAPARRLCPAIGEVLTALDGRGARLVRMSGSGATCFALFGDPAARDAAAAAMGAEQPGWWLMATELL
jgi:4-diphosphocytidyl-2-C-methyl-D-erythritol kinase